MNLWKKGFIGDSIFSRPNFLFTGTLCKVFLKFGCDLKVNNYEKFISYVERRPKGKPLVTYANHHSVIDEPMIWGTMGFKHFWNYKIMRWILGAQEICFPNYIIAKFFAAARAIPVVRGDGVDQKGIDFAIEKINLGEWLHIFPEGKVNPNPENLISPMRWGIGKVIFEAKICPLVVPLFHEGLSKVMPLEETMKIPKFGKKIIVNFGENIDLSDTVQEMKKSKMDRFEAYSKITAILEEKLKLLEKKTKQEYNENTQQKSGT